MYSMVPTMAPVWSSVAFQGAGQAEIHTRIRPAGPAYVLRFEVAVNHANAVRGVQCLANLLITSTASSEEISASPDDDADLSLR